MSFPPALPVPAAVRRAAGVLVSPARPPRPRSACASPRRRGGGPLLAFVATGGVALPAAPAAAAGPAPWAAAVVEYLPGDNAIPGYGDPAVALGPPARRTGAGVDPGVVSPFQAAFLPTEVVSIGANGHLVLELDAPATDDPGHPHGVDLLVFGNAFFTDAAPPSGVVAGLFDEGGTIEVSADGIAWHLVPGASADGAVPTLGWLDAGPYDAADGRVPSDFTRPVDPALFADAASLVGLTWPELLERYDGSGGGTPVDLASVGLAEARYVRIAVPGDAGAIEIDAVARVAVGTEALPEDVDGDGVVGFGDLVGVLTDWGACSGCPADLDGDGVVGFADLVAVLTAWGDS